MQNKLEWADTSDIWKIDCTQHIDIPCIIPLYPVVIKVIYSRVHIKYMHNYIKTNTFISLGSNYFFFLFGLIWSKGEISVLYSHDNKMS